MEKGTSQFCWSAGRCGAMRRGVHAGMPLGCPVPAQGVQQPRPRQPPWAGSQGMGMQQPRHGHAAAKAKAAPHGQAPKAWACMQAAPHGHAAKAWACSSQGQGSPPWALSRQGLGEHAAGKAWASTQQPRPGRACSSQGRGVHAWARWHAPGRRQQGPWGHAGCLRGSGSMARAWHAPWVGCQGRGMPLGPLEGHGSIWGGCCCQA